MLNIANRNIKLFFREKGNVFFSLLGVFIIIGLYLLFLGEAWGSGFGELEGVKPMMAAWIMAGVVAVTSITTTMGAFGTMVEDKSNKIMKDFNAAPIKRYQIVGGYMLSAYVVGLIMSMVAFILGQLYIVYAGGTFLDLPTTLKVLGTIALSVLASTSLLFFLVSFFQSNGAFGTASTVLGSLIGFLTGIYMPIGQLPETVQWIIKFFPVSHSAVMLRQLFMEVPIQKVFEDVPIEYVEEVKNTLGVQFQYGDYTASYSLHLAVLAGTAVLFFVLSVLNASRTPKY
jgi:multidrug/hemolysin transport system permease protein